MAREDLTLREVEEAEQYGLNPDQYDELKDIFTQRAKDAVRPVVAVEVEKEIRNKVVNKLREEILEELPKELEPKIAEDLRPKIRVEVEEELGEKFRAQARDAVKQEEASRAATPRERRAFRDFVREVEVDCLTNAHTASNSADKEERMWLIMRTLRRPIFLVLLLSGAPGAFGIYHYFSGNPYALVALMLPWLIATIWLGSANSNRQTLVEKEVAGQRKMASDYWIIAEQAKRLRMVDAEMATTRGELQTKLDTLSGRKDRIDSSFMPSASTLDESRKKIRDQLIGDSNTEQFLRVEPPPPDEEEPPVVEDRASQPRITSVEGRR